ncbi:hypothetical protein PPTG_22140 [Phytophthora nicotianae INRA-310]|uniref:Uncharacterized protein n=1 Tax=Phytophthora nicotianae (strain INRA-310) TaxID=761204 RepID=W2QQJ3_PHYN3|nr:hypothetical protein PPTG_22140 [Phytophthora nicotianae INRA-310]ETN14530.1 hypothetical protein PPTG_22140 [Phytophthora nicotianae INRA-310]
MSSSVMVKSGSGIPAMLEIWRSISLRHDGLDVRLVRLENGPEGSFIATTKCYFTITLSMIGSVVLWGLQLHIYSRKTTTKHERHIIQVAQYLQ